MPSSNCSAETGDDSAHCGTPQVAPSGKEQGSKQPKKGSAGTAIRIAVVLIWTALIVFPLNGFSAEGVGYWIGILLIPLLIAYAIGRPKRTGNWSKFSYWFLVLGILLPGLTMPKNLTSLSHSDMLKELVGTKPLEDNLPENQREMASASKAFFADAQTFRKSQDEKLAALQPDLAQLYSRESFSSRESIQRSRNAVERKLSLDRETSAMLDRMPELMQADLDRTSLSEAEKKQFLDGFTGNSSKFRSAYKQAVAVESDWANSVRDLYSFSLEHASQIVVTKDKIGIGNDAIRGEFNAKLTRSEALFKDYIASAKRAEEVRTANLKSAGVTETDLGIR